MTINPCTVPQNTLYTLFQWMTTKQLLSCFFHVGEDGWAPTPELNSLTLIPVWVHSKKFFLIKPLKLLLLNYATPSILISNGTYFLVTTGACKLLLFGTQLHAYTWIITTQLGLWTWLVTLPKQIESTETSVMIQLSMLATTQELKLISEVWKTSSWLQTHTHF